MKAPKQALVVIAIAATFSALVGCGQKQAKQQWEYKVAHFDRDAPGSMEEALEQLGDEGWEYAGPLANNGLNAQYVAFKRPK